MDKKEETTKETLERIAKALERIADALEKREKKDRPAALWSWEK